MKAAKEIDVKLIEDLNELLKSKDDELQNKILYKVFKEYGYSQTELAKHLNVSRQAVQFYMRPKQKFSYGIVCGLIDFLGLSLSIELKK